MENEKIIYCPTCGAPIKIIGAEHALFCPNCRRLCILSYDQKYAISEALMEAGDKGMIPTKDKKDILIQICNFFIKSTNSLLGLKRGYKIALVSFIAVAIIAVIGIKIALRPTPIEQTLAYEDAQLLWEEFRANNPYNIQTVGLKQYQDGSFTIIVSEPNESITRNKLKAFLKPYNHVGDFHRVRIGIDGWLKDAVFTCNNVKDFDKFTSKLFKMLYGTDYKASYWDLTDMPSHVDFADEDLNYQVSAEELRTWLFDDKELFHNDKIASTAFQELFALKNTMSVFYSDTPGFVVWFIPTSDIKEKDFEYYSRVFALDSDLILGAVRSSSRVAVIGRERCASLEVLPPMRIETMKMLAQTTKSELSQSYERNHFFAGQDRDGWDLAPILLSDELWHTEYGSMLNITDQMLKSWSENGDVQYFQFNYSLPVDWAFRDGAFNDLRSESNKFSSLTYNWNTAGAGYVIEASREFPYDIYALNRTGSLPVSYIPEGTEEITADDEVYQAEERAYDFFSSLSSPELVKVAEYAALYQIFVNFEINLPVDNKTHYNVLSTQVMDSTATAVLKSIRDFGPAQKNEIRQNYKEIVDRCQHYEDSLASIGELNSYSSSYLSMLKEYYSDPETAQQTISRFDSLKLFMDNYLMKTDVYLTQVGHYLVNPRDIDYGYITTFDYYLKHPGEYIKDYASSSPMSFSQARNSIIRQMSFEQKAMLDAFRTEEHSDGIKAYADCFEMYEFSNVLTDYVITNEDCSNFWIKCPTLVYSANGVEGAYGGHNLNSKITPIKVEKGLSKGQFKVEKVNGQKVIKVSAADKGRITPSLLREIERTNVSGIKSFASEAKAVRPRKLVLAKTQTRTARGFNTADHVRVTQEAVGFKVNDVKVNSIDELFAELKVQIAQGEKLSGKTIMFENFNEGKVRMIMDGVENSSLLSKGLGTKIQLNAYDLHNISYDLSKASEGITIVKVPIEPKAIISPDGRVIMNNGKSIFKKVEHIFEVPTRCVKEFVNRLKSFVREGEGFWNDFLFKQDLKRNKIDAGEIKEIYEYMVAQVFMLNKDELYAVVFEEKVA